MRRNQRIDSNTCLKLSVALALCVMLLSDLIVTLTNDERVQLRQIMTNQMAGLQEQAAVDWQIVNNAVIDTWLDGQIFQRVSGPLQALGAGGGGIVIFPAPPARG